MKSSETRAIYDLSWTIQEIRKYKSEDFFDTTTQIEFAVAIENRDLVSLQKMIDAGSDVNRKGKFGVTPLMWAFFVGDFPSFQMLLRHDADPDIAIADGFRVVHPIFPVSSGDTVISLALLHCKTQFFDAAFPHSKLTRNHVEANHLLHRLVQTDFFVPISSLRAIVESGAELNERSSTGETVTQRALIYAQYEALCIFLEAGADVDIQCNGQIGTSVREQAPKLLVRLEAAVAEMENYLATDPTADGDFSHAIISYRRNLENLKKAVALLEGIPSASAQHLDWKAGEKIPLAVDVGPLGATRHSPVGLLGAADVLGNGLNDLLVSDGRLLPFKRFTTEGVPVYGQPESFQAPEGRLVLFVKDSKLSALVYGKGKIRLAHLNPKNLRFELSDGFVVEAPGGLQSLTAVPLPKDRFAVLFTKGDGKSRGAEGAHLHSADYRPFDGSGIWRGKLSYAVLGAMQIEPNGSAAEMTFPLFAAQRDFLIRCTGLSQVVYPTARKHGVIGAASQGMFYYFDNTSDEELRLEPAVFMSDNDGNGIRHPGIFPSPVAIPDPVTGDSDLLVGDTSAMWFYNFSGRFHSRGGPIYDPPVPVLIEDPELMIGALPVLTSGDVDGDGLVDLVSGNDAGHFFFIRNIGSVDQAAFDAPVRIKAGGEVLKIDAGYTGIQGPPESRWGYTCPTLVDWNGDGLLDIVFNSIQADISVLIQEPGSIPPAFQRPVILKSDTMELHLVWRTQPAVTNWGVEGGRNCIVVNDEQNQLRRFWQVDDYNVTPGEVLRLTTGEPIQTHGKRFSGQWGRTKLQAVDWDGDGNIDLLVGTGRAASIPGPGGIPDDTYKDDRRQASVLFLRNAGTNSDPVFDYPRVMHYNGKKLELGTHTCTPLAIDLGRGELDLLVGEEHGSVMYYPRKSLTWVDVR